MSSGCLTYIFVYIGSKTQNGFQNLTKPPTCLYTLALELEMKPFETNETAS